MNEFSISSLTVSTGGEKGRLRSKASAAAANKYSLVFGLLQKPSGESAKQLVGASFFFSFITAHPLQLPYFLFSCCWVACLVFLCYMTTTKI